MIASLSQGGHVNVLSTRCNRFLAGRSSTCRSPDLRRIVRPSRVLLPLAVLVTLALPSSASASRTCSGAYTRVAPDVILKADQLRARRTTSCRYARYLVKLFLRTQARDPDCIAASVKPGYACLLLGHYECEKRGSRGSCLDQGHGVTFRVRDRPTADRSDG